MRKDSETLDLVCNIMVAEETQEFAGKRFFDNIKRASVASIFAFPVLIFLVLPLIMLFLGGIFFFLCSVFVFQTLSIAIGTVSSILMAGLLIWTWKNTAGNLRGFPTNVQLKPAGIMFAWRFEREAESLLIPWDSIKTVSADINPNRGVSENFSEIKILLDISRKNFPLWSAMCLTAQTQELWRSGLPFAYNNGRLDTSLISLEFPLDSLTLDADKFRLISTLKERVPEETLTREFNEILLLNKTPTYTQLWLDDMQSFRRQNMLELKEGATLQDGRYRVVGRIATGGQAKIYRAIDTAAQTPVVLKELILPVDAGAEVRNRAFGNVKKEALLLSSLNHPGILKLLDNFVWDHRAYLVLEFIDGKTLRQLVQESGTLAEDKVVEIAILICDILSYLHNQSPQIVHRDLAPDNLMLSVDGRIVLLDFNVAQQLESTTTRTVVGKHNYMAPEQFKGKPVVQSDLYSLGCTMFFLLCGVDPRPLTCSHPSALVPVAKSIDNIVARLTELELTSRYKSAGEVRDELLQKESSNV